MIKCTLLRILTLFFTYILTTSFSYALNNYSKTESTKLNSSVIYNLLESDGTFSQGREFFNYFSLAPNDVVVFNGSADFTITQASQNIYDFQFTHPVSLTSGREYTLCFDAKADGNRTLYVDIDSAGPDSYDSLTNQPSTLPLNINYQTFTLTFTAVTTDATARLVFHLGGNSTQDVELDNIGVYEGGICGEPNLHKPAGSGSDPSDTPFDPNFHIYLAFGQSNMEGTAPFTTADYINDPRAQIISNFTCPNLRRVYGEWFEAQQPYFGCFGSIGVSDSFVQSLVARVPANISIGLVPTAIGGSDIALFEKGAPIGRGNIGTERIPAHFDGGYNWLLDLAKKAQRRGVIKGIIFYQGETNTSQPQWKNKVSSIIENLRQDLDLGDVPFLAGELLYRSAGGCCGIHNTEVNFLPELINNAHVIPAHGLEGVDNAHFSYNAYKIFGQRYADKMFELVY